MISICITTKNEVNAGPVDNSVSPTFVRFHEDFKLLFCIENHAQRPRLAVELKTRFFFRTFIISRLAVPSVTLLCTISTNSVFNSAHAGDDVRRPAN